MDSDATIDLKARNIKQDTVSNTLFYGWRIVALTTLSQMVAVGCTSYIFGLYVVPIATEFGASRFVISSGMAVVLLTMTVVAPLLGHWLDKHSIRNTMTLGAFLMGLGFASLSQVTAIWQIGIILVWCIGLGAAMLGHLPSSKLVTNWFVVHRGKAMGFSTLGTSLGGFLLPPIMAWLILSVGWRDSFLCLSLFIVFVVVPVVFFTVRNKPQDMGLLVDGKPAAEIDEPRQLGQESGPSQGLQPVRNIPVKAILSSRAFWGLGICVGFMASGGTVFLTNFVAYSKEFAVSLTEAALVISSYSAAAAVGKLSFGYLADYYDMKRLFQIAIIMKGLAWVVFLEPHGLPVLVIGSAAVGFSSGATMPLWNSLVAVCFGPLVFARVMGYMGLILLPLVMIPVLLSGFIFDRTGSYVLVFQLALMLYPLAFLSSFLIRIPEQKPIS